MMNRYPAAVATEALNFQRGSYSLHRDLKDPPFLQSEASLRSIAYSCSPAAAVRKLPECLDWTEGL